MPVWHQLDSNISHFENYVNFELESLAFLSWFDAAKFALFSERLTYRKKIVIRVSLGKTFDSMICF